MSLIRVSVAVFSLMALGGCAGSGYPPPALPEANPPIIFVPQSEVPKLCNHIKSPWVCACTLMDKPNRPIIMALPQSRECSAGYAEAWLEEFAHHQRGLPDPPQVSARLISDQIR